MNKLNLLKKTFPYLFMVMILFQNNIGASNFVELDYKEYNYEIYNMSKVKGSFGAPLSRLIWGVDSVDSYESITNSIIRNKSFDVFNYGLYDSHISVKYSLIDSKPNTRSDMYSLFGDPTFRKQELSSYFSTRTIKVRSNFLFYKCKKIEMKCAGGMNHTTNRVGFLFKIFDNSVD